LVGHLRAHGLGDVCAHFVLVGQSLKLHCTNRVSLQLLQRHFLQTRGSDSSAVGIWGQLYPEMSVHILCWWVSWEIVV
jgi:hypothetical protein